MWQTVNYKDEYLNQIIDMTKEYYGSENDIADKEYITYEYFKNINGNALMKIAFDKQNNTVAGQYVTIPMKMKVQNKSVCCLMSVNTLTKEEYRGQKIFTTLADNVFKQAEETGYAFVYGMPNQNSYPGFVNKLNFHHIGSIPLYLKILKPSNLVKDYIGSNILSKLAKPFDLFFNIKKLSKKSNLQLVKLDNKNLHLADIFWDKIKNLYPIMIERNSLYLKFRYIDIPKRRYDCYFILENEIPVAFACGRVMEVAKMNCGMIADFIYLDGHEASAEYLLNHMVKILKDKGADMIGVMMQSHFKEAQLIKKCGFFKCPLFMEPQPFYLILRTFNKEMISLGIKNIKNWFFTMGDYDVV